MRTLKVANQPEMNTKDFFESYRRNFELDLKKGLKKYLNKITIKRVDLDNVQGSGVGSSADITVYGQTDGRAEPTRFELEFRMILSDFTDNGKFDTNGEGGLWTLTYSPSYFFETGTGLHDEQVVKWSDDTLLLDGVNPDYFKGPKPEDLLKETMDAMVKNKKFRWS